MSGLVTGIVLDRYPNGGGERLVAVALADNAHRDGTRIFPSIGEICDRTKLSRRTVQMHIAKMVDAGWLILTRKSTGRRGDTNEYRICPAWLAGGECTPPEAPVLRTNAKREESSGAKIAPHDAAPKSGSWGAIDDAMGRNLTHDGAQPIAPKPSGTVIGTNPPTPLAGGAGGFDDIAAGYPRRARMALARKVFEELAPDASTQAEIVRAIRAWKASEEWQRERGRYVPKLADFLRDRRWLDAPGTAAPPPAAAPPLPPREELSAEQLRENGRRAAAAAAHARAVLGASKAAAAGSRP